jgi:hypothetical protein
MKPFVWACAFMVFVVGALEAMMRTTDGPIIMLMGLAAFIGLTVAEGYHD